MSGYATSVETADSSQGITPRLIIGASQIQTIDFWCGEPCPNVKSM
jgi:hypothetical protein